MRPTIHYSSSDPMVALHYSSSDPMVAPDPIVAREWLKKFSAEADLLIKARMDR